MNRSYSVDLYIVRFCAACLVYWWLMTGATVASVGSIGCCTENKRRLVKVWLTRQLSRPSTRPAHIPAPQLAP